MTRANKQFVPSRLDRAVFALITRGWNAHKISGYETALRARDKALSAEVTHTFASIDTKATGLLTHVSMMIAGLGLAAPLVADNEIEVGIIVAEIAVYLLIAVGSLRCLAVFRTHEFVGQEDHLQEIIHHELIIRTELYAICIRAAIGLTIVVFLVLPVLYFWTPEKHL